MANDRLKQRRNSFRWVRDNPDSVRKYGKLGGRARRGWYQELFDEYLNMCAYCGVTLSRPHLDHFVPMSKGGTDERDNLIPACKSCNSSKGNKSFLVWLATKPRTNVEIYLAGLC